MFQSRGKFRWPAVTGFNLCAYAYSEQLEMEIKKIRMLEFSDWM